MKSIVLLIAMIGCAVATSSVVTTLNTGLNRNSLHIQNGPPFGGSLSAELPSVGPLLSQLAPLALSLGGNSGSLGDLASLGSLLSLGSSLLPQLPSVQVRTVPISIPLPFPYPSFTPITYAAGYPYSLYAGARIG